MSRRPNFSIDYSAPIHATASAGTKGTVVIDHSDGSGRLVVATSANRSGGRRSIGIALADFDANDAISIQEIGLVSREDVNLGPGSAGWVRVSSTGQIERVASPDPAVDDLIGKCDADGTVFLTPYASMDAGNGVPATSDVGASVVYNAVGAPSEKRKKAVPPGHFDPEDYGDVGDGTDPALGGPDAAYADDAFDAMMDAINPNNSADDKAGTLILRERFTYYFRRPLIFDRPMRCLGQGGGTHASLGTTTFAFRLDDDGAATGLWLRARGFDRPFGLGASIDNVNIVCEAISGILSYAHDTAYAVGDLVQFGHDHSHQFRVVKVTGDAKTSTALAMSGADAVWSANTAYSVGDVVVPTASKQNGHKYVCKTAGTSHATTEPNDATYGGWHWWAAQKITDGTAVWEENGIYQPHHSYYAARPYTRYDSDEVCRQNSKRYEHNQIVRIVGHANEWDKWLWIAIGSGGTTASSAAAVSAWLTTAAYDDTFTDGTCTWTCIDPIASGLLFEDDNVLFMVEEYPAIAYRVAGCTISNCRISGATGDAISIYGKSVPPFSNCNFWLVKNCTFALNGGGGINVRGDDANGGVAFACKTAGQWPLTQADHVEAHFSYRDYASAGGVFFGCRNHETAHGYAFDLGIFGGSVFGGYAEGGPTRCPGGSIVGLGGSANESLTRTSAPIAPAFGRGVYGKETRHDGTLIHECRLAGVRSANSSAAGRRALEFRVTGEGGYHGTGYRPNGWAAGYWANTFQEEIYAGPGSFSTHYWTSDLAPAWCDLESATIFGVPYKSLGFGIPTTAEGGPPFGLHFRSAIPVADTWKRGQIIFYEGPTAGGKIGAVCVTGGTPGTWKEFGAIDP